MKALKFKHDFVKEILEYRKTTTWRLFDDKNLMAGDELELVDRDSNETFANAVITDIQEKKIRDLTEEELKNHDYTNTEDVLTSHRGYYGDKVNLNTDVKMISFKLI